MWWSPFHPLSGPFIDDAFYSWLRRSGSLLGRHIPDEALVVIENQTRYRALFAGAIAKCEPWLAGRAIGVASVRRQTERQKAAL